MPKEFDAGMAKDWPSITDKAACVEKQSFSLNLPIAKYDSERGIVTGWAALSSANGEPVVDFHNDLAQVSELEKAAHELMIDGGAGKAGEMHAGRVGDIVESLVLSKEKAAALGLGDAKTEGWIVSMKLRDPGAIERARSGDRSEMSIHGLAKKIVVGERDGQPVNALVDISVDEISIVDHGASGNGAALPKIVIAKKREQSATPAIKGLGSRFVEQIRKIFGKEDPMNLDAILAKLTEEERAVVLAAIEQAAKAAPAPVAAAAAEPAKEVKPPPTEEQVAKMLAVLPAELRKKIEEADKAKSETAELRKRLDERDERDEIAKFKAKAESFPFLAGKSTAEIAKALRAAAKSMKPEEYETIEKVLANANEAVKGSPLFTDNGNRGNDSETTAIGKIQAKAAGLRQSDSTLSPEQAISKALGESPELFSQYKLELSQAE